MGKGDRRQRTLTLSMISPSVSGAKSRVVYPCVCDRRSSFKALATEMPEWAWPSWRNLTLTRPPGRWGISGRDPTPDPMPMSPGPTLDARYVRSGASECDGYRVTGPSGGRTDMSRSKPPRPTPIESPWLKPPSSRGGRNWLSDGAQPPRGLRHALARRRGAGKVHAPEENRKWGRSRAHECLWGMTSPCLLGAGRIQVRLGTTAREMTRHINTT